MNHYIFAGLDTITQAECITAGMAEDSIKTVIRILAHHMGVTLEQVQSPSRKKKVTTARFIIIRELRTRYPKLSLKRLGMYFGGRDHSTVLYALDQCKDLKDDYYFQTMERMAFMMYEKSEPPRTVSLLEKLQEVPHPQAVKFNVMYRDIRRKWICRYKHNGKYRQIGSFATKLEAIEAGKEFISSLENNILN